MRVSFVLIPAVLALLLLSASVAVADEDDAIEVLEVGEAKSGQEPAMFEVHRKVTELRGKARTVPLNSPVGDSK